MKNIIFPNKKGVSAIVATVILIALVIGLVAVVWAVVTGLVKDELGETKACFGNFDKVTINRMYTCYDTSGKNISIALGVSNVVVDEIVVSISGSGESKSFRINGEDSYAWVKNFAGEYNEPLNVPGENSGKTYIVSTEGDELTMSADILKTASIKISPVMGKNQCDVSDSLLSIPSCNALAS